MQKITPFLWFDDQAEQAVDFYLSVFKGGKITSTMRAPEGGPTPAGTVLTIGFELNGQEFTALNGGPVFKFTEAISFVVSCANQAEVDDLWMKLTADGGEESQCGWLKDKYGLSWQIVPTDMYQYIGGTDPVGSKRAMEAMMKMRKLDLDALRKAYEGK